MLKDLNNCKISLRFQSQYFKIKFIKAIVTSDFKDVYLNINSSAFNIYRDTSKTTLTLVTCTKNTQETQTIFILELINVHRLELF